MENSYNPKNGVSPLKQKLRQLLWRSVNITLFRYSPFFCHGFRRFLLRCFGAKIAKTAHVYSSAKVYYPPFLTMGEYSCLASDVECYNVAPIAIGANTTV